MLSFFAASLRGWKELALIFVLAMFAAFLVRNYFLTPYRVPSGSMQPSLKPGDFIFVSQVAYVGARQPQRGDLVTFYQKGPPRAAYVKRVVGLPGDRVEIKRNRLVINGLHLSYEKIAENADNPNPDLFDIFWERIEGQAWQVILNKENQGASMPPLIVPPGEIFLLGDNRDTSDDSRTWGTVPIGQIFGKASFIWLSLDWQRKWAGHRIPSLRWERIFTRVH